MASKILNSVPKIDSISDNNTQTMLMVCQKSKSMRNVIVLLNKDSGSHRETEHNRSKKFITHSMLLHSVTTAGPNLARRTKTLMVQTRQWIHLTNKDRGSKRGVAVVNCCKWNKNYSLKSCEYLLWPIWPRPCSTTDPSLQPWGDRAIPANIWWPIRPGCARESGFSWSGSGETKRRVMPLGPNPGQSHWGTTPGPMPHPWPQHRPQVVWQFRHSQMSDPSVRGSGQRFYASNLGEQDGSPI